MPTNEEALKAEIRALTEQTAKLHDELRSMLTRTQEPARSAPAVAHTAKPTPVARPRRRTSGAAKKR